MGIGLVAGLVIGAAAEGVEALPSPAILEHRPHSARQSSTHSNRSGCEDISGMKSRFRIAISCNEWYKLFAAKGTTTRMPHQCVCYHQRLGNGT